MVEAVVCCRLKHSRDMLRYMAGIWITSKNKNNECWDKSYSRETTSRAQTTRSLKINCQA